MKSQFNGLGSEELKKRIAEMRMQIMKLNSELAAKAQSKSVGQLHKLKRSIAQACTALTAAEKQAAISSVTSKGTPEARKKG